METKQKSFTTAYRNIEIDIVRNEIKLLRKYAQISDATAQERFMRRFHPIMRDIIKKNKYSPTGLIRRLNRAIKLDKYRPRNLSLFMLAISPDLYNIRGEFDTFDAELSQMFNCENRDDAAIRNKFNEKTANRHDLAKQVCYEWMERLKKHPELVAAARNSTIHQAALYQTLLNALARDFCTDYGINSNTLIEVKVVNQFTPSENRYYNCDKVHAFCLFFMRPFSERQNIQNALYNLNYTALPKHVELKRVIKIHFLRLKSETKDDDDSTLFSIMLGLFTHEMQHIVDIHIPRAGALGPQIAITDRETYVPLGKNTIKKYFNSATELSAYKVHRLVKRTLNKQR